MPDHSSDIRIERVADNKGIKQFIEVPLDLYRDDPAFVMPLRFMQKDLLDRKSNPYFDHAKAEYWVAYRGDKSVGRITAQIDELALKSHGEGTGHFGFIEGTDDPDVFAALTGTAEAWLRTEGMKRVLGPFNLSVNEETGLLIDGFEHPPRLMMGHALPYYGGRLEEQGYGKAKDVFAYDLILTPGWPEGTQKIVQKARQQKRLVIRSLDKKNIAGDLAIFIDIFNDAWADNWGFVPFTDREIAQMADDLSLIIKPKMCNIAYWDGEPAAFMLTLPDLNQVIAGLDGKLFPFGWYKLLTGMILGSPTQTRVPLMGVRKKYQSRLPGAFMALLLIDVCRIAGQKHYNLERGELSWILEDNVAMSAMLESIGCVKYKTYRIYEKSLV